MNVLYGDERRRPAILVGGLLAILVGLLLGGMFPSQTARGDDACPRCGYIGQRCRCEQTLAGAGHPQRVAPWAVPENPCRWFGYYVGGSHPVKGNVRHTHEGTFGWDYLGIFRFKRVALFWDHGARDTSKSGSYEPDGPKILHHE